MKKILWILGIIVVAIAIVYAVDKKSAETEPIKIGMIMPLSGDAAAYGEVISKGVILAAKQINDDGGVNGKMIEIISEDGKCSGKDAASAAQKLVNVDKVKFIIGGVCSGEVFGYAPITNAAGVVTITPGGSNPDISNLGDYVFRLSTNDATRGVMMADYVAKSYKKIAFITEQTDYAKGLKIVFEKRAGEIGLPIVASEEFASGAKDFRSLLGKIKESGSDIIFLNVQTEGTLIRLADQARTLGLTQQFIGSELNGPVVVAGGKNVEGIIMAVAPGLATKGKAKVFSDAFKTVYGTEPAYGFYVAAAYDSLHLFADAIRAHGTDPVKVKDYIYSSKNREGAVGTYSFDQNGDVTGVGFVLQKLVSGKFVDIK